MTIQRILLLALTLLLVRPAFAIDLSSNDIIIPVVGQFAGANMTDWRTDLFVGNPDRHTPVTVDIAFHAEGESEPQIAPVTLQAREVMSFRGVIASLFGRMTGSGYIQITTHVPTDRVWARARIYNYSDQSGSPVEFGQSAPAIPVESLSRNVIVAPLPGDQGNRSNAGITNPNPFEINVSLAWFEPDGSFAGGVTIGVPARSVYRINDIFTFTGRPREVPLSMEAIASAPVYFWGSVVRNENGDASFIVGTKGEE